MKEVELDMVDEGCGSDEQGNKDWVLTLSEQAQLSVVELFQKALLTMKDVSSILGEWEFKIDSVNSELVIMNPEISRLTADDLLNAELETVGSSKFKNKA